MCIFVERKYVCRDPYAVTAALLSMNYPAPIEDPHRPWKSYKHGQVVNPENQTVWHVLKSRVRCACSNARLCSEGPHEVRTELYINRSCPDCTGTDRCISNEPPTLVAVDGHDRLTLAQQVQLARVAEAYLDRAVSHEVAMWSTLQTLAREPSVIDPRVYIPQLFISQACTIDHTHICEPGYAAVSCRGDCPCIEAPDAHNIVRCFRMAEADRVQCALGNQYDNTVWTRRQGDGGADDALDRGQLAQRVQEYRDNLEAEIRHGEDVPQDWFSDNPDSERRAEEWHAILWTKLMPLRNPNNPKCVIHSQRIISCAFMLKLIANDPGLSTGVADLVRHWIPYFVDPESGTPSATYLDHGVAISNVILSFITLVDNMPDRVRRTLTLRMNHRRHLWAECYNNRKKRLQHAHARASALDAFFGRPQLLIDREKAEQDNLACPICGGAWGPHWFMMSMPCCRQPAHIVCMRSHFHHQDRWKTPSCPFCRQDMTQHGWELNRAGQECFAPFFTRDSGLVPAPQPHRYYHRQPRSPPANFQALNPPQNANETDDHWPDEDEEDVDED